MRKVEKTLKKYKIYIGEYKFIDDEKTAVCSILLTKNMYGSRV